MIVNDNDKEPWFANRVEESKRLLGRCSGAIERVYRERYIETLELCCYRVFMAVMKIVIGMKLSR